MSHDMNQKMAVKWHPICQIGEIPRFGGRTVRAGQMEIAVFRLSDDRIRAVDNFCPHKQGPLADGIVSGDTVICPLHARKISLESGEVLDAVVARTGAQRAQMWRQREMAFEVATHLGMPVTTDVAVPLDKVQTFLEQADARLAAAFPACEPIVVAHLGDGNLHYSVWVDAANPGSVDAKTRETVYTMVEDVVAELHGSFSAEHGIGLAKRGTMARRKDAGALQVMRAIKAALDPGNIMNPGKTLP